ncbi:MAG: hypothetical protein GXP27_00455, partial [Planctomycetes bacterium]|nr:hypothetical protein [Planctomycetota bacterium]
MSIQRVFVDWGRPALEQAAQYLLERFSVPERANLQSVVAVVPGARAGRRLLEILVDLAEQNEVALFPPRIVTVGELPELLYVAKLPFADDLTQNLAWVQALKDLSRTRLGGLLGTVPDDSDFAAWLGLAERLAALHRELAADRLDFEQVAQRATELKHFTRAEAERWQVLREIQQNYLHVLDERKLWDKQTARLFAIERGECRTDSELVLIGTVDMNRALRAMLDQVADRVTALIFAPEELADDFDEHGCLISERWRDRWVRLEDEQIRVAEGPGDQADEMIRALAQFNGRYSPTEITIGTPDERVVPYVRQRLQECGVPARYGAGERLDQAGPVRLLEAVGEFLPTRSYGDFASLVRHPDVAAWLSRKMPDQSDPLAALDEFHETRLPARMTDDWLESLPKGHPVARTLSWVLRLLRPFSDSAQSLAEVAEAVRSLLVAIYGGRPLDLDRPSDRKTARACQRLQEIADGLDQVPTELMPDLEPATALRLIVRLVGGETLAPVLGEPAIELLGWLELPLDDAPALIVTGLNEGIVPSSRNADLFLPDGLRRHLQLEDNDRRFARDVYALHVLAASRERLVLITGRRTADNEPLLPSRLLFPRGESLPRRTRQLLGEEQPTSGRGDVAGRLRPGRARADFPIPQLPKLDQPVRTMRVTEFRDYLACPYRYFLRHRLGLATSADTSQEMPPNIFGGLIHYVLQDFGTEDVKDSTSAEQITEFLEDRLAERAGQEFGSSPLPAVRVQLAQARERLRAFAQWQARWRQEGWRIEFVEHSVKDEQVPFRVDGEPMYLIGRIDRIDRHEDGRVMIFDYKTGGKP